MLTSLSEIRETYAFDQSLLLGTCLGIFFSILFLALFYRNASREKNSNWWILYLASEGTLALLLNVPFTPDRYQEGSEVRLRSMEVTVAVMAFAAVNLIRSQLNNRSMKSRCARHFLMSVGILALLSASLSITDFNRESVILPIFIAISLLVCGSFLNFSVGSFRSSDARVSSWPDIFNFYIFLPILVIATSLSNVEKWAASEPRFWLILNVLLFSSAITLIFRFGEGLQKSPGTVLKNGKSDLSETDLQNHVMSLVSHELRNELSVMNTALSDLARYKNSDARVSSCQTQLVNVYLQMKHVVESFLLAERLESKSSGIIYSFVEPRRLVSEAIDTVRRSGHQCAIHVDATTLPERSRIDGDVFKVVLINVLQNAIKYSGSKSEIFIRGSYADKNLKISVIDNGIGMSKMAISQLCQHHFRADPNSKGAGLGLYLVRLMLKAHGGGVRISSTPNRGTNVEFWLDTE